ncbi:MAG: NAD(P)/FAD-dependent oxidoreductase [Acidimicrobiales bacterium]
MGTADIQHTADSRPHRVAVVGGGFGGLFAVRVLRRAPVEVTLVDRTNHHLFQPLLYQVATGILSAGEIAPPIRDIVRRQPRTTVVMGEVTSIDLGKRTLRVHQGDTARSVAYDSLIVASGSQTSYFGNPGLSQFAPGMKTVDDALELRGRIFGAFEMAECETDPQRRKSWLTFAIVGGGPTGVEMAGQIIELSRRSLRNNFRNIDPRKARVLLFDAGDAVLTEFGPKLAARTKRDLQGLGIELHLGAMVTAVDDHGIVVRFSDGSTRAFATRTKIWAAGVSASPLGGELARQSSAGLDRQGRVQVLPDCSLPGHPEVFVVGDLMALENLPGVAEVAMQSGIHAAKVIAARLRSGTTEIGPPLRYWDLGSMATIARFQGVARIGRLQFSGFMGWAAWLFVHLTFLTGFKNRISALAHWTVSFLGRSRAERTITEQQVVARLAIETHLGAAAHEPRN